MKEWFTAQELAGIPGLPGSVQGIGKRARKEGWEKQRQPGREGKFEYHISTLPDSTRAHLSEQIDLSLIAQNNADVAAENAAKEALKSIPHVKTQDMLIEEEKERHRERERGLREFAKIPAHHRRKKVAKARQWILKGLGNHIQTKRCSRRAACKQLSAVINRGDHHMPDWVLECMPKYKGQIGVSAATLAKWDRDFYNQGIMGLADNLGNRAGQSVIAQCHALYRLVLGAMFATPQITGRDMIQFIKASNKALDEAGDEVLPVPSQRAYERFKSGWIEANEQVYIKLINPDKYKNVFMAATGSHFENIERLNQLWELDSTPADWMLEGGRHSVVGVIDMYSRRLKYYVSKTSKSMAVCQVMRQAITDWGVPEGVRTDNGQDYVSDQYDLVLSDLGIEHQLCIPFASEEKGTIERSMRTLSHGLLNLLPGFIGHDVAERKEIEARKSFSARLMTPGEVIEVSMSAADLQQHLDQWCEHVYGMDKHSGINMSPFMKAQNYSGEIRRIEDERALDMLLCEMAGVRRIGKKGIRFNNHTYFNDGIGMYIGKDVLIKYDEADIGRLYAYVESQFIGVMICSELLGISSKEAASATKHKQAKHIAEQAAELRSYKHAIKKNIGETVMEYRISESENLVAFPQKSINHTTTGLEQAAKAVQADAGIVAPKPLSAEEQAVFEQMQADDKAAAENTVVDFGNDPVRDFRIWEKLKMRDARGEDLTGRERDLIRGYAASAECAAMKKFNEAE